MPSHEIDYQIFGAEMQLVEIELDPDEAVIAEAGSMTYMEDGIDFDTKLGDGSSTTQGFFGALDEQETRGQGLDPARKRVKTRQRVPLPTHGAGLSPEASVARVNVGVAGRFRRIEVDAGARRDQH